MRSSSFGRIAGVVLVLAGLAGPAFAQGPQGPGNAPPATGALDDNYVVGASDVLRVAVFDEPTLSGNFTIDADGSIQFPLVGRLDLTGMTLRQVEDLITMRLMDGFVRRPQVTVEIQAFRSRSVFVMGEVRVPGQYPIEGRLTLLEALAAAGSTTPTAGGRVMVLRAPAPDEEAPENAEDGQPILPGSTNADVIEVSLFDLQRGMLSQNIQLQEGDTVFVPQAQRFFVTGEVNAPGDFVYRPGMTVLQAISLAGGLTDRGSDRRVQVIRTVGTEQVTEDIDLDDLVQPDVTINVRRRLF